MTHLATGLKLTLAALALLFAGLGQPANAQSVEQSRLEAAMTLRLLTFTNWPDKDSESAARPIRIGVLDAPEQLAALKTLLLEKAFAGRFEAKAVSLDLPAAELEALDALFFGSADSRETARALLRFEGRPTVLVGASEGFLERGGMVNLTLKQKRLGFEIDLARSRASGITYRAQLLRLATRIVGE